MINKKIKHKIDNSLLNLLFQSKNFYGQSSDTLNRNFLPYIYGIRNNYVIIDLQYTSFIIKRVLKLIQHFFIQTKKKKKKF